MDKCRIYIGTIKKCIDIKKYNECLDEYLFSKYSNISENSIKKNTSSIVIEEENVVLIKTLHGYIRINDLSNFFVNIRLTYEFYNCILHNRPYENNELFVDESTLKPFYKDNNKQKVRIKTLKYDALKIQQ